MGGAGAARGELAAGRRGLATTPSTTGPMQQPTQRQQRGLATRTRTRHRPEHDKNKDTRNALDHVQLLDRRAGRPLHPPPRWSFGSPPPTRPTGRGAADGPFVRTHSRAARRSGLAVRIRAPRGGRRRDHRRGRPRRGLARGVRRPAHRRARPRSGRSGGGAAAVVGFRGPRHAHCRPVLHVGVGCLAGPGFGPLSGVLLDLGVSSPQLDWSERGFSFREDGPLDMRMDPTTGPTAADLVNTLPVEDLAALFRENGEGRLSGRIARAVVKARPLTSTRQLAEVVASAVPAPARRKGHPARRVFQALRIQVNDELGQLEAALPAALSHLEVGGVCAVISYHSGEDRLTKQVFADAATGGCVLPSRPAVRLRRRRASSTRLPRRRGRHRRRRSPPIPAPRAPACGPSCGQSPKPSPQAERPDGASSRSHRSRHPPPCRCGRRTPRRAELAVAQKPLRPGAPRSGSSRLAARRGIRGGRTAAGRGRLLSDPVRLHGGGRVAGRRRGAGPPGQRSGEPVRPAAGAHLGAERPQPSRVGRRPAGDSVARLWRPPRQTGLVAQSNLIELPYVSLSVPLPTPKVTPAPAPTPPTTSPAGAGAPPGPSTGSTTSSSLDVRRDNHADVDAVSVPTRQERDRARARSGRQSTSKTASARSQGRAARPGDPSTRGASGATRTAHPPGPTVRARAP